jgi:outer membrane protein assembly factor BamB
MTTKTHPPLKAVGLAVAGLLIVVPANLRGDTLFGLENKGTDGNLFTISPTSGEILRTFGDLDAAAMTDLAFDNQGTLFGVSDNGNLWTIDTLTGAATSGPFLSGAGAPLGTGLVRGIAFDEQNTLYASDGRNDRLLTADPETGVVTPIGEIPFVEALTFGAGGELYASAGNDLLRINPETADVTTIGSFGTSSGGTPLPMPGLVFDESAGVLLGADGGFENNLYEINTDTGEATLIGSLQGPNSGFAVTGLAIGPAAIPEPTVWLPLVMLGVGVVIYRRVRQTRPAMPETRRAVR